MRRSDLSARSDSGVLRRVLQIIAVGSWLPLAYFNLSLLGHRPAGGPILEFLVGATIMALPWLTLFACLSFFLDRRSTSWWVWPSNLAFVTLSIGPSVFYGYLHIVALTRFIAAQATIG